MRRTFLVVLLAAGVSVVDASELEERAIQLRHQPVREAAAVVEPMLSPQGSVLIQPGTNSLTVRDRPEVVRHVVEVLTAWDVVPRDYRLRVRLILASTAAAIRPGQQPAKLEGFGSELTGLFRWSGFEEIDSFEVQAREGASVETKLGQGYTVRFTLRASPSEPERVQLAPCEVLRLEGQEHGIGVQHRVHRSNVSLRLGQTFILVTARSEEAKKALVVVLGADRETAK
ncbi:MAG: hypothetical protein KA072_08140 [Thermoanaerobaculaceae bacterium]|nr:hypothetical protein [Thermoanaerobaculaceae bacterium]MDI9622999.1 secretin N-terminal domain-containing protein [Acidobacteriota bacterium]NLH12160.1 hypothetical protein [Holophagae bacterium]HPW54978.1 secretin N-terminal domain-containing protein [Thermoanaerobaculaceae bacterium]